jgi:hypothetical protein
MIQRQSKTWYPDPNESTISGMDLSEMTAGDNGDPREESKMPDNLHLKSGELAPNIRDGMPIMASVDGALRVELKFDMKGSPEALAWTTSYSLLTIPHLV